jgi:hypothetical protein
LLSLSQLLLFYGNYDYPICIITLILTLTLVCLMMAIASDNLCRLSDESNGAFNIRNALSFREKALESAAAVTESLRLALGLGLDAELVAGVHSYICLSTYPTAYLLIYPAIYLSIYLPLYRFGLGLPTSPISCSSHSVSPMHLLITSITFDILSLDMILFSTFYIK